MWAPSGRPWIATAAVAVAVLAVAEVVTRVLWLLLPLLVALFFALLFSIFFRDPDRLPGKGIVAPADGKVCLIREEGERVRIATFMNVYNVHVNRVPWEGTLTRVEDRGGPKRPAFSPEAEGNSQKRYSFDTALGPVEVVQITGIVARRCIAWKPAGTTCAKGERFGMIAFGSRVDLVLPRARVTVVAKVGQKVHAGTDTLAEVRP